jgi:TatD DNase family protein
MPIIDTHSHIDSPCFDHDRDKVIERANAAGVNQQIVPAIQTRWWSRLKACCDSDNALYPAYGLHPLYTRQHNENDLVTLSTWLESEPATAVGECGLDFYNGKTDLKQQILYFEAQLDLARQFGLPVIIHARRSVEMVIQILKKKPGLQGVLHSYSGSYEQAAQLIDLGFSMGFGGPVTSPQAKRIHNTIKRLPLDAILLETDSPDQPDYSHKRERNEPAYLADIAQHISNLLRLEITEMIAITSTNSQKLFSLPDVG